MELTETPALNQEQKLAVKKLEHDCCTFDHTSLSFPTEEQGIYLLLYDNDILLSALSAFFSEDHLCECVAFTDPAHRRRGFFRQLLEVLIKRAPDEDIAFAVSPDCEPAVMTLHSLEAGLWYEEYMMELHLSSFCCPKNEGHPAISITATQPDTGLYFFIRNKKRIGSFRLMLHGHPDESTAYFYGFEIFENLRGKGLGTACFHLLLESLCDRSTFCLPAVSRLKLQVSSDNLPALAIYQKAGFQITDTLAFYLY